MSERKHHSMKYTENIIEINLYDKTIYQKYQINSNNASNNQKTQIYSSPLIQSFSIHTILSTWKNILLTTFLPVGYPHSVRKEYLIYQFWDSVQGISSYLRGVLTARSILTSVGVGSAEASAIAGAVLWAMKDGVGMIASLSLAYYCSDLFEVNFKEWRLVADILNNIGLTFDLLTSVYPKYVMLITSASAICHSCCGLIAGSTKARISSHFAISGHLADVTAKESTQETAIALIGLTIGMVCTKIIGTDIYSTWIVFSLLLMLHTYANYNLIKVLILDILNPQRAYLVATSRFPLHIRTNILISHNIYEIEPTPMNIAKYESLYRPLWLAYYGPKIGISVQTIIETLATVNISYNQLYAAWNKSENSDENDCGISTPSIHGFIIGYNTSLCPVICLFDHCTESNQLKSYMIAVYLMYCNSRNNNPTLRTTSRRREEVRNQQLRQKYESLLRNDAKEAMTWYENSIEKNLFSWGWDISENKSRLSMGKWRISTSLNDFTKEE